MIQFKGHRMEWIEMARKQRVLEQTDFEFSGVVVSKKGRGSKAILSFVDKNGLEIDRQQALRREYSAKYRHENPDRAKQSSRDYAASVRRDAAAFRAMSETSDEELESVEA